MKKQIRLIFNLSDMHQRKMYSDLVEFGKKYHIPASRIGIAAYLLLRKFFEEHPNVPTTEIVSDVEEKKISIKEIEDAFTSDHFFGDEVDEEEESA